MLPRPACGATHYLHLRIKDFWPVRMDSRGCAVVFNSNTEASGAGTYLVRVP